MQDIPSLIDPAITELDECIFCHHAEMDDLNQCATCLENICASCPMNACSCPGGYGIEAQLRTELRVKAMELGTFKAAGRQGIITETQQEHMNSLDSKVNNLIYELMICDKQSIPSNNGEGVVKGRDPLSVAVSNARFRNHGSSRFSSNQPRRSIHRQPINTVRTATMILCGHRACAGCESVYSAYWSGCADQNTFQAALDERICGYGF